MDLVTFTEAMPNGKLRSFCAVRIKRCSSILFILFILRTFVLFILDASEGPGYSYGILNKKQKIQNYLFWSGVFFNLRIFCATLRYVISLRPFDKKRILACKLFLFKSNIVISRNPFEIYFLMFATMTIQLNNMTNVTTFF